MKKHYKILVAALSAMIILASGCKTVYASEFQQESLDGVVYIISELPEYDKPGTVSYFTGTGFFVGLEGEDPQYIITNCHVIEDFLISGGSTGNGMLQIAYDKDIYEEAYVVTYNVEKDIALLKLAKPTDQRSPLILKTVEDSDVGSTVFAVGYPYTAEISVESVNYYGKNDASVTGGRIGRILTEAGTGRQLVQMDVSINQGNSGGPLVDGNGFVVGINTYSSTLDNNLNYAVGIEEAIPMLKNNNIPYEIGKVSDFNQYLYLIIGAAAVLLVVLVVFIIVLNKGKKKTQIQEQNTAASVEPVPVKKAVPVIRSMSSQHLGMTAALTSQPIIVGRDPSICRIIFKDDTPGVSSRHCQIYYDDSNKTFILTDLKSSYGTFLSNGQKLTPNVPCPLRLKDSFYLGEKDNAFYLDLE